MTADAALWMFRPRSPRIQLHSDFGIFLARRSVRGSFNCGARAATRTHFSTVFCMSQSSVVVTR